MDLLAVKKNQVQFFTILESIQASRERVVSYRVASSNSTRNGMSKRRVNTVQEPQYRQHALISDSLDLPNLSLQQEATFATNWIDAAFAMNWIDDRPDGLTLQNFALATMTGPVMSSLPKNLTADVHYAIDKCESLGSVLRSTWTRSQLLPRSQLLLVVICQLIRNPGPVEAGEYSFCLSWNGTHRPSTYFFALNFLKSARVKKPHCQSRISTRCVHCSKLPVVSSYFLVCCRNCRSLPRGPVLDAHLA